MELFLESNLDFLLFSCGLLLLLLSLLFYHLIGDSIHIKYFALFALLLGFYVWTAGYCSFYEGFPHQNVIQPSLLGLSMLFLTEGSRRGLPDSLGKTTRFYPALLVFLIGLTLFGFSYDQLVRLFGLTAILNLIISFFTEGKHRYKNEFHASFATLSLALLALSVCILSLDNDFFHKLFGSQLFFVLTEKSVLLLWTFFSLACLLTTWAYFLFSFRNRLSNTSSSLPAFLPGSIFLFLVLLLGGWLLTDKLSAIAETETHEKSQMLEKYISTTSTASLDLCEDAARCMSASPWIIPALLTPNSENIEHAKSVLSRYATMVTATNCILFNQQGEPVASHNSESLKSNNHDFILQTLEGQPCYDLTFQSDNEGTYSVAFPVFDPKNPVNVIGATVVQIYPGKFFKALDDHQPALLINQTGKVLYPKVSQKNMDAVKHLLSQTSKGTYYLDLKSSNVHERLHLSEDQQSSRFYVNNALWSLVLFAPLQKVVLYRFIGIFLTLIAFVFYLRLIWYMLKSISYVNLLSASEKRFRDLFIYAPEAIVIIAASDWSILEVNPLAIRLLTCSEANLTQKKWHDFIPCDQDLHHPLFNTGTKIWTARCRLNKWNQEQIDVEITSTNLTYKRRDAHLAFIRDLGEHQELERRMAHLDRLNMVGQIAAGVAHEIRNPLTAVKGFLQLMKNGFHDLSELEENCIIMLEELERANDIITEFLSLVKNKPPTLSSRSLDEIIHIISPLLEANAISNDQTLIIALGETPPVLLDESEVRQLILNLVRNAIDASSTGGTVKLITENTHNQVLLKVQDQGKGIPIELIPQLGTPFFTTKEGGTGLGLAICYRIAARHNASIDIDSGHEGTTFTISFPLQTDTLEKTSA